MCGTGRWGMRDFEIIEHTADAGIIAYGAGLEEAFANAARAMFSLMADLGSVREEVCCDIQAEAPDREGLLVAWLSELLYVFEVEGTLFSRFEITHLDDTTIKAKAYGEPLDAGRHSLTSGIKAVTYHMLKIEESDGCRVQVIFDA
mgnify:FL=1